MTLTAIRPDIGLSKGRGGIAVQGDVHQIANICQFAKTLPNIREPRINGTEYRCRSDGPSRQVSNRGLPEGAMSEEKSGKERRDSRRVLGVPTALFGDTYFG